MLGIPVYDRSEVEARVSMLQADAEEVSDDLDFQDSADTPSKQESGISILKGLFRRDNKEEAPDPGRVEFDRQCEVIRALAQEGPCIIIGRCADEALAERKNVLNIFIHASEEFRISRVRSYPEYNEQEQNGKRITDFMSKIDRQRQSYYNYYASGKWGKADNYDFCIDSSLLGIDGTVHLITQLIDDFEKIS